MKVVKIGNKLIGEGQSTLVIAEIGINHNGDIKIAKKLIDIAVEAGADAVKFQKRTLNVVYTPEELATPRKNPFGPTNGDLKQGLEFGQKEYKKIDNYCKKKEIMWFASPWDETSVDFLEQFNLPCYKIASCSLTDDELLLHIRSKNKPIILSTGMSDLSMIKHAIDILGDNNLILLHCTSTYPAKPKELNILGIKTLKREFPKIPIGYSGHESGITPTYAAVVLGAVVVERHITLNRSMWGSDQAASVELEGMRRLIRYIRNWETVKGDGNIKIYESEFPIIKKLRRKY